MGPFNRIDLRSWSSFEFLNLGVRGLSGCFTFPDISRHVSPIAAASLLMLFSAKLLHFFNVQYIYMLQHYLAFTALLLMELNSRL